MYRVFMVSVLCIGCSGSSSRQSANDAAVAQQADAARECASIEGRWRPEDETIDCEDLIFEDGSYRMEECGDRLATGYYELEPDGCSGDLFPKYPKLRANRFSIDGTRMTISAYVTTDELYYVRWSDLTTLP